MNVKITCLFLAFMFKYSILFDFLAATTALYKEGKLVPLLTQAGAIAKLSA